jgi:uncharacterized protein involved in exopolysaccharide biosynthesis
MNETLALPPRLVIRDLMLTGFSQKRRLFLIFLVVMAIAVGLAASITPDYKAESSLLVLLSTENAYRPAAGQQFVNTGGLQEEEVMRTESGILGSPDLHRQVVQQIGIGRLYPKLLRKPGPVAKWLGDVKTFITNTLGITEPAKGNKGTDVLEKATQAFGQNLTITVNQKSSVIGLAFTNPDAQVAAEALKDLEADYLTLRAKLYNDVQAPIVKVQQQDVAQRLAAADQALQQYKQKHDISNFADRRQILLQQQGDLEAAMAKSEATIAGEQARLQQLGQQMVATAGNRKNAAAALQSMVSAFKRREVEAETQYRGSPAVAQAREQMLDRETDIARMQATQAFGVESALETTEANLKYAIAGHDAIRAQLGDVNKQITALDAEEMQLHQLELNRAMIEDNYKNVTKILDQRQIIESVEAHRESSVRVIQPPEPPLLPLATRRLILVAGLVISLLLAAGSVLMSHFFRAIYLRPEALELDTGLTVLASVPEMRGIAGPSSAVLVVPG